MKTVMYENPKGAAPAQGLYSHAAKVTGGTLYFIAGQLSVGSDGSVVGAGDFDRQFARVFENLGDVLKGLGGDFRSIIKFTTYLVHSQDIGRFMKARGSLSQTVRRTILSAQYAVDRRSPCQGGIFDRSRSNRCHINASAHPA